MLQCMYRHRKGQARVCLPVSFGFEVMQCTEEAYFENKNLKKLNTLGFVFQGFSVAFNMLNACIFLLDIIIFKSFKYSYLSYGYKGINF